LLTLGDAGQFLRTAAVHLKGENMKALLLTCALVAALGITSVASAQTYPSRPIIIVVPFAAGGPVDTVARIMADPMRRTLGQPVVVENVTGAAGTIGVGRVARAAPDGYTVSIGHWSTHVVNGAIYSLPYDLLKDLEPVAMIASNPMVIVANNAAPAKNLNELLAWMRTGKLLVGTAGVGSGTHMSGVYFQNVAGTKLEFVPYRGTGPAMQELLAGRLDLIVDQLSNSLPQVRSGRIRAYAVTAKTRSPAAPDIPSVDEAGLAGFHMSIWYGTWVPRGTPKAAIAKLNSAIVDSLADPVVRRRLGDLGLEITPRDQQTPEALRAHHKAEIEKWWPMIKAAGIKVE
jgi:tripartite-type tricarboxylate transporter receptor subunit TctC